MLSARIHVTTIRFALFFAIHQAVIPMQQFAELGPALLFFGTWIITKDIFLSTMVLIGGVSVFAAYEYATKRKLRGTTHLYLWSAWILGGLTLLFRDETFILWKPTIVNWIFCGVLFGAQRFANTSLFQLLLGKQLSLPREVWFKLGYGWSLGFFIAGALNLIVAYNFSLDFWMAYKLVGGFGLTLTYTVIMMVYLHKLGLLGQLEPGEQGELSSKPKE